MAAPDRVQSAMINRALLQREDDRARLTNLARPLRASSGDGRGPLGRPPNGALRSRGWDWACRTGSDAGAVAIRVQGRASPRHDVLPAFPAQPPATFVAD